MNSSSNDLADQLKAARIMRERLIAVLETTAEPGQLLFSDIAALDEWIARLNSECEPMSMHKPTQEYD